MGENDDARLMSMRGLVWIRRTVAVLVLVLFVVAFIQAVPADSPLYWVERAQLVPALLSGLQGSTWGWLALGLLALATLLLGRVYCSWVCPLGIMQDVVNRLRHPRTQQRKGKAVRYTPNHWQIRLVVAALVFGSVPFLGALLLTWLDPYSIAGRLMAGVVSPAVEWVAGAGELALQISGWLRYAPWLLILLLVVAAVPLGMALLKGRLYCNTICPVGSVLGLLSRLAPLAVHMDGTRCVHCGSCLRECKAHAIDPKGLRVDATRCVACYACLAVCESGALGLRWHSPFAQKTLPSGKQNSWASPPHQGIPSPAGNNAVPPDRGRRAFIGLGLVGLAAAGLPDLSAADDVDPGKASAQPGSAAIPPGAGNLERFLDACTGCGLCISACPTHVLRPSYTVLGWRGLMKPYLDYSAGFCDPGCHACSQVCPTGALSPLSLAQKQHIQIALVEYHQEHCRVWQDGESCALCAEKCPTGAIRAEEVQRPHVMADLCTGCKAKRCYNACPTGSISYITREDTGRRLAVVSYYTCIGCGYCAEACSHRHAIAVQTFRVPRFRPELCTGCGACAHTCPATPKALELQPRRQHLSLSRVAP